MRFGQFLKERRKEKHLTLREFCITNRIDPGLWSKLERGKIPPPENSQSLDVIAEFLGIKKDTDHWQILIDLASSEKGRKIEFIQDDELVEKLPIFFQTLRSKNVSDDKFDLIIEIIREEDDDDKQNTYRGSWLHSHKKQGE
jgi:transcriptional regulator with XRE-family HTH domain